MIRLLLITLLVLSSGPAYAEWEALPGGGDNSGLAVYVDPVTIHGKGDLVKMWSLFNYTTIQTNASTPYSSYKTQNEYDCKEERSRLLAITFFSGQMGRGQPIHSESAGDEWHPVAPESIGRSLWKRACGNK
jgi:hypothetical protein